MAFGFEILHGRGGAAGHCRELEGRTMVHVRGVAPGKTCVLYALLDDRAEKRDEQTADGNGQAVLTGKGGSPVFISAHSRVILWQGGEENYLRASEWMKREQTKTGETQQAASPEPITKQEDQPMAEPEDAVRILARDLEEIQLPPEPTKTAHTAEPDAPPLPHESEPAYSLRSPGPGDPVDALPD